MKPHLAAIAFFSSLFILCAPTFAEDGWTQIAETSSDTWSVKNGSFEFTKTKAGKVIAVVVGRMKDEKTNRISLYKWYVSADDCANGMGKMVSLNLSGEYQFETDFVTKGGSVASTIGETICSVAEARIKTVTDKSI